VWRWRYARGETLPERFWLPIVRALGRTSLARGGRSATLEGNPTRGEVGQLVRVRSELLDQSLVDARPASLEARIVRLASDGSRSDVSPTSVRLAPEDAGADPITRGGTSFSGEWLPDQPGRYVIEPTSPLLAGLGLRSEIEVVLPDDEMRRPQADHALLASICDATGGRVLAPSDLAQLPNLIPNRAVTIEGPPEVETLWDKPVVLVTIVLLLGLEWVVRKLIHLI
ncbi:MAG: hypothetical protein RBS39_13545, partial [Phycisphaerales bacterium]|jgi:hypothetical protein|nr:hypothetical protein [Phycisphaerales bacterium]